jgi:hypothetical protein
MLSRRAVLGRESTGLEGDRLNDYESSPLLSGRLSGHDAHGSSVPMWAARPSDVVTQGRVVQGGL